MIVKLQFPLPENVSSDQVWKHLTTDKVDRLVEEKSNKYTYETVPAIQKEDDKYTKIVKITPTDRNSFSLFMNQVVSYFSGKNLYVENYIERFPEDKTFLVETRVPLVPAFRASSLLVIKENQLVLHYSDLFQYDKNASWFSSDTLMSWIESGWNSQMHIDMLTRENKEAFTLALNTISTHIEMLELNDQGVIKETDNVVTEPTNNVVTEKINVGLLNQ